MNYKPGKLISCFSRTQSNERGFTMIEVMIAASLLILAIVPLLSVMEFSALTQAKSQLGIVATNIANQEIEKIKSTPYNDVGINSPSAEVTGTVSASSNIIPTALKGSTFTVNRSVKWYPSTGQKYSKKVTISVNLAGKSTPEAILTTLIGPTGVMPFNDEPAETNPPTSVYVITPYESAVITTSTASLTAVAYDDVQVMMIKYFIDSSGSYYGYRIALNDSPNFASVLDVFNLVVPEPPLPDGVHNIFAQAIDTSGNSANSPTKTFTLMAPPTAPSNLSVSKIYETTDTAVLQLTWGPSQDNDAFHYDVYRRIKGGDMWPDSTYLTSVESSPTVYYDIVAKSKTYRYRLKARDNGPYWLMSNYSNEVELQP